MQLDDKREEVVCVGHQLQHEKDEYIEWSGELQAWLTLGGRSDCSDTGCTIAERDLSKGHSRMTVYAQYHERSNDQLQQC